VNTSKGLAFILKTRPFKEKDYLVTFFSLEHGIFNSIACGVKGSTKGWCGNFLLFSKIKFERNIPKSDQSLTKITGAEVQRSFEFKSVESFTLASFCAEVAMKLMQEGQEMDRIFQLMEESFCCLEKDTNLSNFHIVFLLKFLTRMGFLPDFSMCTKCGNKFSEDTRISWEDVGDILCSHCSGTRFGNLSFLDIKVLFFWQYAPIDKCLQVSVDKVFKDKAFEFLSDELCKHMNGKLKTASMLNF